MIALKSRIKEAADVLKVAGLTDVSELLRSVTGNKDNTTGKVDIIDLNAYFAYTLWNNEDIISALEEEGYEANENNIQSILEYLDCTGRNLSEIINEESDTGYHVIRNAITELAMDLEPADKEMVD